MTDLRLLEIDYDTPPQNGSIALFNGSNWEPNPIIAVLNSIIPPGFVGYSAAEGDFGGWLICDGRALSRTTYAALFERIQTTYGVGDGSTTFNIPNAEQRFILSKADSGTGDALGETGGQIDMTVSIPKHHHGMGAGADLNITSSGSHSHGVTDPGHTHAHNGTAAANFAGTGGLQGAQITQPVVIFNATTGITVNSASHTHASGDIAGRIGTVTGGQDGNTDMTSGSNNPPYIVMNAIIWTGAPSVETGGALMGILGLTYP